MQTVSYKKKIPWWKIGFVFMVVIIIVIGLSLFVPGLAGMILGALTGLGIAIYTFFVGSPSWLSVVAAVAITLGVVVLITQRKYFVKQTVKVATPLNAPLQSQLQGANSLFNPVTTTDVKVEDKT